MLAGALVVVPSAAAMWPDLLPKSSTTWYYANLAQSMAQLGAIPAQLPEWGALRPFQTDYLPVTAHTAAALLLLPGDLLPDMEVYRLATLVLGVLFAVLLFRRWVSGWAALLGAILLLATVRLEQKFDGYRPETVALVLALFTLWVADRAFAERNPRALVVALARRRAGLPQPRRGVPDPGACPAGHRGRSDRDRAGWSRQAAGPANERVAPSARGAGPGRARDRRRSRSSAGPPAGP